MSSVLVRGMELPKNCEECDIHFCKLWMRMTIRQRVAGKHPDCPLIEVKTPHGRLIDADEFAETIKKVSIMQGYDKLFSDNILSVGDVFDAIATDLK